MNIIVRSSLFVVIFEYCAVSGANQAIARSRAAAAALRSSKAASQCVMHKAQAAARAAVAVRIARANRASVIQAKQVVAVVPAVTQVATSAMSVPQSKPVYSACLDWRRVFRAGCCDALVAQLARLHKEAHEDIRNHYAMIDMPQLLHNIIGAGLTRVDDNDSDIPRILRDVAEICKHDKILIEDHTTQNISAFLLWIMCRLSSNDCYKTVNQTDLLRAIKVLKNYKPEINYRNSNTLDTIAKCCGRIGDKALVAAINRILHH